ncbi:MAG: tautomerase family protein [Betaproteobacteria bacterium]|nr:tautomerase family protein [Betaproteobacteria bacterium]
MPVTRIEGRRARTSVEVQALIEAVYLAQREALQLPVWDRQIRYVEYKPEHFHAIPGTSENYVLVEISMFSGRSLQAKRSLYQRVVQRLANLGVGASDITIVIYEVPPENWGIRGGVPASEVELGFKVDV